MLFCYDSLLPFRSSLSVLFRLDQGRVTIFFFSYYLVTLSYFYPSFLISCPPDSDILLFSKKFIGSGVTTRVY